MSRQSLTAAVKAEIDKKIVYPVRFYEFDFSSGVQRYCTNVMDLSWNGKTWNASANLIKVSTIQERSELTADSVVFEMNNLAPEILTALENEDYQGRDCNIWFGFFDSVTGNVIGDPVNQFSGQMDSDDSTDSGDKCSISLIAESEAARLRKPNKYYYTDADQQLLYPGDLGLGLIAALRDKEIILGPGGSPFGSQPNNDEEEEEDDDEEDD